MFGRSVLSVSLAGFALALAAGAAAASPSDDISPAISPIGPKQTFVGLVNGAYGRAVIQMGCFGPVRPGQMGHPLAGQSVAVTRRVPIVSSTALLGFTGVASSIAAYADFPSPVATPVRPRLGALEYYDQPAKISTDLLMPCGGSGRVVFEPIDGGPTARPATVTVTFQGQE